MAGIAFLRRLLMKQAMKKSEDASGILSLNKNLVNDVDNTVKKWIESAKKQGQDIDKMGEQEIKYIVELNKPKVPHTLAELMEKIGLNDPKKNKFLQKEGEVIDMTGKKIDTSKPILGGKNVPEVTDVITDTVTKIKTMEPVAAMKEANTVIGRKGIYKNLTKEQSQKILKDTDDWIFQRDPDDLYDYNKKRPFRDDPDPEDFAHGGRTGSGLNYLLGEDDQNSRVPYAGGGASFAEYLPQLPANGYLGGSGQPNPQGGGGGEQQTLQGLQGLMSDDGSIGMPTSPQVNFSYFNPANPYARGGADNQLNVTPPETPVAMQQPMSGGAADKTGPNTSVEDAYAAAKKSAQEYRKTSPHTQNVLPGETSFEDFSKNYGAFNNWGGPMQLPSSPGGGMQQPFNPATPRWGLEAQLEATKALGGGQPGNFQPGEDLTVPEVPGAIQQPMPGDTSFGVMKALPNLNNEFFPTPSYDTPEVSEEQKITDPYQRAGGYKKQPAITPEEEVRNRENSVAQAVGAQPGALSQALGLAEGGRIGLKKGSKSWTDRIAGWTGGKNIMAGEIGLETWDLLNNLLQSGGLYAEGGRTGFGIGGLSRRAFLKLMGGAAAGTAAAKSGLLSIFKGGATKSVIKDLASVPIKDISGMPVWFKPLVNRVIKEGDDVTKKFATADREIVHQVSLEGKIGKDALGVEDVRVTQNLDEGTIRVEYNTPDAMGESGVDLLYKKGEEIPIKKKGKNTSVKEKDEFTASEDDIYPQQTSPDGDFDLEFTENIVNNVDDLYSDTSKLKQFATGEKLTIKEISDATKKKNYIKEVKKNPNDHAFGNVTGDDHPLNYGLGEKKIINMIKKTKPIKHASGGRVPLAEGSTPSAEQLQQYYEEIEKQKKRRRLQEQFYDQRFGIGSGPVLEASQGGLAGLLGE